jgi:hypothetical protein
MGVGTKCLDWVDTKRLVLGDATHIGSVEAIDKLNEFRKLNLSRAVTIDLVLL